MIYYYCSFSFESFYVVSIFFPFISFYSLWYIEATKLQGMYIGGGLDSNNMCFPGSVNSGWFVIMLLLARYLFVLHLNFFFCLDIPCLGNLMFIIMWWNQLLKLCLNLLILRGHLKSISNLKISALHSPFWLVSCELYIVHFGWCNIVLVFLWVSILLELSTFFQLVIAF